MKNNKFLSFLEAIKTDENKTLVNTIITGFKSCCESGMNLGGGFAATPVVGQMMSSVPHNISDADLPVEPNVGDGDDEVMDSAVRQNAVDDIKELLERIKTPEGAAILDQILKGEI